MNLQELNLVELNAQEKRETDGGWVVPAFWIAVAWSAWENVGDIREGFSDGLNNRPPRY